MLPAGENAILFVIGVPSFIVVDGVFCNEGDGFCADDKALFCSVAVISPGGNTGILCADEVISGGEAIVSCGKGLVFCTKAAVSVSAVFSSSAKAYNISFSDPLNFATSSAISAIQVHSTEHPFASPFKKNLPLSIE